MEHHIDWDILKLVPEGVIEKHAHESSVHLSPKFMKQYEVGLQDSIQIWGNEFKIWFSSMLWSIHSRLFQYLPPLLAIYIVHETDAKLISDWEQNTLYTWPLASLRLYPDHKVSNAFGKASPQNSYLPNNLPCQSRKFTKFLTHALIMHSIIISIYINDLMNVRLTNKNI